MNELIKVEIETKDGVNFVSSRVIASELGKEHKHVLESIRKIGQNLDPSNFIESSYLDSYGRTKVEYLLTKDGFTLYMFNIQGYNEFKMAYINRFNEMEKALKEIQPKLPRTYKEALRELLVQVEENERLQIENESMKPKANYFDTLVERGSNLNLRDTAKMIGVSERYFIEYLLLNGYLYRDAKRKLKPIAKYVGKYFVLKEWVRGENTGSQTLVTVEGKDKFYKLINK